MSNPSLPKGIDANQASVLLQALASDGGNDTLVRRLLQNLELNDEQMTLADSLLAMNTVDDGSTTDYLDDLDMPEADSAYDELIGDDVEDGELDSLREVNDTVAAALGACKYCWGGNDDCNECEGAGRPGSLSPDRELFSELVMPAVQRIREDRTYPEYNT